MGTLVPFDGGALPAHLKKIDPATLNDDLLSHAGGGFPVLSIKGKVFATVRDGERKILPNPKDPDSPATSIDVVLVKANKATSKIYYIKGYTEGAEAGKPDCFSADGVAPDPGAALPQSKVCATCKHSVWGSKIGDNGQKSKACQDSVRLAISTPGNIKDPYLLRVPPASIRALGEYGKVLKARGVSYDAVLTRIAFEMESPTPKLLFKPVGFLPEELYTQVKEVALSDTVQNILGSVGVAAEPADPVEKASAAAAAGASKVPSKTVTVDEVKTAVSKAEAKEPMPAPGDIEIDLASLRFDD